MILILDGHNLLHRARSGFRSGDHYVAFNFFRQLRALVGTMTPTRVYMAMEGRPLRQQRLLPEYKKNREIDATTQEGQAKSIELADFHRQKDEVVNVLSRWFPVTLVGHPDFEGDDVVHNIIRPSSTAVPFTVVSTDTDFIQLLQRFTHVNLYNPVKQAMVSAPAYDYVHWKALRGDDSDNIPRVGNMTDKRAEKALLAPGGAPAFLSDAGLVEQWRRNCELVRFHDWTDDEAAGMWSTSGTPDWTAVRRAFESWGFRSLLEEATWEKFTSTFDALWPPSGSAAM